MLGLGLQATLRPKAEGAARPVQDGLVLADNFRKSPVNDELGLTFPSNGSAVFNGTSDYIQLPDPFSNTNHTIAAWINPADTPAGFYSLFDNRDGSGDGISSNYSSANKIDYPHKWFVLAFCVNNFSIRMGFCCDAIRRNHDENIY
jgi:hypothetical protein